MKALNTVFGYSKYLVMTVIAIISIATLIHFNLFGQTLFAENHVVVPFMLGVAGFLWNIALVTKLPALTHYLQAGLLPNYHRVLGKQVKVMMMIPLVPMLVLIPDFRMMNHAMTVMLVINLLMLILMYKPLALMMIAFLLMVVSILLFGLDLGVTFKMVFDSNIFIASLLPTILIIMNGLIDHLPKINVSERQLNLMKASVNQTNQAALGLFVMPDKKHQLSNPVQNWIANFNLRFYSRGLARKVLPNFKLIELALMTQITIGPFNYLLAFTFALIGFIAGSLTGLSSNTPFIIGLTCGLIGSFYLTSTLVLVNTLMQRKPYIAQLSLSPLYRTRQRLRLDVAHYIVMKTGAAALGAVAILWLFSLDMVSLSTNVMVFNTVLVSACFFGGAGLVLIATHRTKQVHWSVNFGLILIMFIFSLGLGLSELTDPEFEWTVRITYISTVLGFSFASFFTGLNFWRTQEPVWEGYSSGFAKG
jgi:hypothetical protein